MLKELCPRGLQAVIDTHGVRSPVKSSAELAYLLHCNTGLHKVFFTVKF